MLVQKLIKLLIILGYSIELVLELELSGGEGLLEGVLVGFEGVLKGGEGGDEGLDLVLAGVRVRGGLLAG